MPVLNFPSNPTLNQTYSFNGKTWIWNGQGWALSKSGALNGIVIGNVVPAAGTFTTLAANTFSANSLNIAGVIQANAINSNTSISALGNVTGGNFSTTGTVSSNTVLSNTITATGNVAVGNLSTAGNISAQYFIGNGALLTGIDTTTIRNGTSNVTVPIANGNVLINVAGNNIVTVANSGVLVSGIVSATGNVTGGNLTTAGNVDAGNVNTTGNISAAGNVTAGYFFGNVIGNISGNLVVPGANTEVIYNNNGQAGASAGFTYDQSIGQVSVTGNVKAAGFTGSGVGLSSTMSDKGGDPNNWNTLLEMGTYTVNRVNWGGVTGPPLDSLVYVGLLTVSASNTVPGVSAVQQTFSPGTVDPTNIKIQWVRNYWSGSWTPWVKMVNDVQQIDGGAF